MEIAVGVALLETMFAWAVLAGRAGTGRLHRLAFRAGLAGLLALPLTIVGFMGVLVQALFADIISPAGILLMSMAGVLVVALGCVLFALIRLRSRASLR